VPADGPAVKKNIGEALYWTGASLFVVLGAVAGLMYGNLDSVRVQDVTRSLAVLLPCSVVATLLLLAIHRPLGRVFPAAIFLYFSFYDINKFIQKFGFENVLSFTFIILCLSALYIVLRYVDGLRASLYTFVAAAAMASVTLIMIAPSLFYDPPPGIDAYFEKETLAAVKAHRGGASALPDIIYVIPDRYPSRATLGDEFGFDNTAFYGELRKRGFFVAENSWANYPKTFQSMASTLNSGYLQDFTKAHGANSSDKRPIYQKMETNVVQDRLRKLGYRFHNYGNWWGPTRINRWAAVNYQGYPPNSLQNLSEFERALLRRTPTTKIVRLFTDAEDKRECTRIKRKFRRIREVGNQAQPVFVLAHFAVPHNPIFFDAAGRCLPKPLIYLGEKGTTWKIFKAAFVEYLKYFNTSILEIIDQQLRHRGATGRKLLFVIQADEGPYPKSMWDAPKVVDFSLMSRRELKMKTGIINALLLPEDLRRNVPNLTTPVNNWRIIFDALTGSKMNLLPDKVFIYPTDKKIFDFCEITDIMTKPEAAPTCKN
ncbi:MAG: hypothetical protein V3R63_03750, partial [Alphaproteobacteria bacterium]